MIHLEDLTFGYKKSQQVLRSLALDLPKGTIVGLLGRNGEGKTTLLKNLYGQLFPTSGTIEVLGFLPRQRHVPFLQQVYLLAEEIQIPEMTFRRYFDLFAPLYPNYSEEIAQAIFQDFQLDWKMNFKSVSQGQKKKAMIAFAIAIQVPLLLLDEPTNGLDIPAKGEFRRAIARYTSEEQTILISTHQVRDLEQLIDRVVILEGGRIQCNEEVSLISERLYFGALTPAQESQALYRETSIIGSVGILPLEEATSESAFSMELFFNAFISGQRESLLRILHATPTTDASSTL